MSGALRVGVIGVGQLGSRHAQLYTEIPGVDLVGVCDLDKDRLETIASSHSVRGVRDFRELIPDIQAASVAVPTVDHHEVTSTLLEAGVHVLVEKPIASTVVEAESMVDLARRKGLRLGVGHTERYNPAVEALLSISSDPRFIEVHRLGSFSPRSLDIDVVLDLMIHDLDVVQKLVRSEVRSVEAVGVAVLTPRVDIANARIRFANGAVANVTASRVSQEKIRKLRVFEKDCYISVDYQNQEALRYRLVPSPGGRPGISKDDLVFERDEPLRRELIDFIQAVERERAPRVSGEDGLSALELAVSVVQAMETAHRPTESEGL